MKSRSIARRSRDAYELQEAKRRVEKLMEELRPYSESEETKRLHDGLKDMLMELTVKIEAVTSHC